jgi:hypothetical protein
MPVWKVLLVALFAVTCFSLVLGTAAVLLSMDAADGKWWWFSGGLVGSVVMSSLFVLFLRHADSTFKR